MPNVKRIDWPGAWVDLYLFMKPIYLTPSAFYSHDVDREEGVDGKRWGLTWLFFTVAVQRNKRIKEAKAGFL